MNDNLRKAQLEVAVRKAAHFANFVPDANDDEAENVHVGGNRARDLGMFSTLHQLEQNRERATAARENRLGDSNQQNIQADFSANQKDKYKWIPSRDVKEGPPLKRNKVSSLGQLTANFVCTHIEHVETLYNVPEDVKNKLGLQVSKMRKLSSQTIGLFTEDEPTHVYLPNVSEVDKESMVEALEPCLGKCLQTLALGYCGYGFGHQAVQLFRKKGPLENLYKLSLGGAYQLSDADLITLLQETPNLTHLALVDCQLFNGEFLQKLPDKVIDLDVSGCRGIQTEHFEKLFNKQKLVQVKLDCLPIVSDELLVQLTSSSSDLQLLSMDWCKDVTDDGFIKAIKHAKNLRSLNCDRVTKLTDNSIQALVQHCTSLQEVSFRNCFHLTDEALSKLAANCNLKKLNVSKVRNVGSLTITALTNFCYRTMQDLDISFCSNVSDNVLGKFVDKCRWLESLRVFGCSL
eukprot:TRINITY_DN2771_c0_g1_i3.p1 TRINITY_DN2771_c0_g1~~TRINITY_DN2771_c0_g1_i3.p1  ORF type:complete len:478 (+),score=61.39 TRINITY_DN2771_c0_g1_i3:52-1434(+)